jgi:hypothetical protein
MRRRRVRQTVGLEERLAASARDDPERARSLPPVREWEDFAPSREAHRRSYADDRMAHDAIN